MLFLVFCISIVALVIAMTGMSRANSALAQARQIDDLRNVVVELRQLVADALAGLAVSPRSGDPVEPAPPAKPAGSTDPALATELAGPTEPAALVPADASGDPGNQPSDTASEAAIPDSGISSHAETPLPGAPKSEPAQPAQPAPVAATPAEAPAIASTKEQPHHLADVPAEDGSAPCASSHDEPAAHPEPDLPEPARSQRNETALASVPDADAANAVSGKPPVDADAPPPGPPPGFVASGGNGGFLRRLLSGNLVAKFGLLILFIGLAFLLKYAAAQVVIPIELRLAGVAAAGVGLIAWGWRIRTRRAAIGLPLQGTGIAVLMMTVFGACRLWNLMPNGAALALLVVLTAFACMLALLQEAPWLAVFGISGAFAAPLLVSTGQGSHVALFSYYGLLNTAVFAIALLRAWRALTLIGFVFTFGVGMLWGYLRYEPGMYLSAQAFLALFVVLYMSIAVLSSRWIATREWQNVDHLIAFATPMIGFGMQCYLVYDKPFGTAFAALAFGTMYAAMGLRLRRQRDIYGLQVDMATAMAIGFATLAIPFALDGRWTASAWAVEGAAALWAGLRARRTSIWTFGLALQVLAWMSFLTATGLREWIAPDSSLMGMSALLLGGTAFASALRMRTDTPDGHASGTQVTLATLFLLIASLWSVSGAWHLVLSQQWSWSASANLLAFIGALASTGYWQLARRLQWQVVAWFGLAIVSIAGLTLAILSSGWFMPGFWHSEVAMRPYVGVLILALTALHGARRFELASPPLELLAGVALAAAGMWIFAVGAPMLAASLAEATWQMGADPMARYFSALMVIVTLLAMLTAATARRMGWARLSTLAWPALLAMPMGCMLVLYEQFNRTDTLLPAHRWLALAILLAGSGWLLDRARQGSWNVPADLDRGLHVLRSLTLWLLVWPVVDVLMGQALGRNDALDASWRQFVSAWLMMALAALMLASAHRAAWPAAPFGSTYAQLVLPFASVGFLLLVMVWNLSQDGTMSPLPYLPLLNPLDLSTAFAALLAAQVLRALRSHWTPQEQIERTHGLRIMSLGALFIWFNLVLLRSVSHYAGIEYEYDKLYHSRLVQAVLSLAWALSALLLMWRGAARQRRRRWICGASLLGIVSVKLFLVDLAASHSIERIISFVGVGALMICIGYLAPFPNAGRPARMAAGTTPP